MATYVNTDGVIVGKPTSYADEQRQLHADIAALAALDKAPATPTVSEKRRTLVKRIAAVCERAGTLLALRAPANGWSVKVRGSESTAFHTLWARDLMVQFGIQANDGRCHCPLCHHSVTGVTFNGFPRIVPQQWARRNRGKTSIARSLARAAGAV